MPANLVRYADEHDEARPAHRQWMAELPRTVDDIARRWSLDVGRPFQPGGGAAWVAPARNAAGEHVVLKVGWRHDEALHEADGLRAWDGEGAVRLLDALTVGQTSALLLEACVPRTSLAQAMAPPEQDVVVAGLLRRLWIAPPAGHPFRTLASMCDWWADEFEEKYAAAPSRARAPQLDPGMALVGMELFRTLPATADREVLLATDLHAGNVLAAEREPWLVIDPKPYVGDPTYDLLQHILNCPDRLAADPEGLAERMAELCDLDGDRLHYWLFARCVQESVDRPDLQAAARRLAP